LATVAASARTPSGQPDNRLLIYGELPEAVQTVNNAVALMTEVLQDITFNADRGKALVDSSWILATDLAETLVLECGLDFRGAHQLVAFLASEYHGKSILELDHKILMQAAENVLGKTITLTKQQLKTALDANLAIQARTELGGTATPSMDTLLMECREKLASSHAKNQTHQGHLASKQRDLLERAIKELSDAQTQF
jgi:argininosuccinate lyase